MGIQFSEHQPEPAYFDKVVEQAYKFGGKYEGIQDLTRGPLRFSEQAKDANRVREYFEDLQVVKPGLLEEISKGGALVMTQSYNGPDKDIAITPHGTSRIYDGAAPRDRHAVIVRLRNSAPKQTVPEHMNFLYELESSY